MAKMEMNEKDEQAREKYLKRIEKLRLMDDDFFSEALDGKCEAVEYILRIVLRYRERIKEREPDGHGFMEA